ncbi:hypothetical protein O181_064980 [Austropuccinia psidii MF-1]|uniref:Uncharacterized protein n=1 Tax=Austropuccinia psidii MF-1 TaxID=1389203 RepID=A0A9Q3I3N5_9BASI|nr:hypothetical protein [Austropuccinia psidii MF-1]
MSCKGQVQNIKAWWKNQSILSEDQKKELAQKKKNIPVEASKASKSKNPPRKVPKKGKQTPKRNCKGKGKFKWALPTELQDLKERKDSHGKCVKHGKSSDGIQKQGGGKNELILSKEIDLLKLVSHVETCNEEI